MRVNLKARVMLLNAIVRSKLTYLGTGMATQRTANRQNFSGLEPHVETHGARWFQFEEPERTR